MKLLLRFACLLVLTISSLPCLAKAQQRSTSPRLVPELRKFEPFIGVYSFTAHSSDEPDKIAGSGTLEVSLDARDFQVKLIFHVQSQDNVSEAGWLVRWDRRKRAYYVKHFTTSASGSSVDEGFYQVRFKSSDVIFERAGNVDSGGRPALLRFRWALSPPNELRIVSEHKLEDMEKFQGVVINAKRRG